MDAKPPWVPDWVWLEYVEDFVDVTHPQNDDSAWGDRLDRAIAGAIVRNKRCECVWQAIDRRRGQITAYWQRERERNDWDFAPYYLDREASYVITSAQMLSLGFPPNEWFTVSQRAIRSKRIGRLARELADELWEIGDAYGELPSPFVSELNATGRRVSAEFVRSPRKEAGSLPDDPAAIRWIMHASQYSFTATQRFLDALERAAADWAASRPPVSHLAMDASGPSTSAFRLYFVREMTAFFRKVYDTPLREQVAALTSVLFACDFDAATVAVLAP